MLVCMTLGTPPHDCDYWTAVPSPVLVHHSLSVCCWVNITSVLDYDLQYCKCFTGPAHCTAVLT